MPQNLFSADNKRFYKSLFIIVAPLAIQNLITAAVSSADVIMLGYVGQTALAAASLAGQVQFVLLLFYIGISSGLTMLTSQYWGKKDSYSIETLAGIAFKLSCSAGFVFSFLTFCFPQTIMRIFTNEIQMIETGAAYLRYISLSYFFMSFSQVFQAVFKSIGKVATVTVITFAALGLNVVLNACFIFGIAFFPPLGIKGVAIATTISRFIELSMCVFISFKIKDVKIRLEIIARKNKILRADFYKYALPALGNEFVWGAAFAMYSVILGHKGEDIVAANSVVGVARNLASIICFGMAYGGAILLGNEMGKGDLEIAKKDAGRLWKSTAVAGIVGGLCVLALSPVMLRIGSLNDTAVQYLKMLLYINAFSVFGAAINTVFICGVFRAGGDAKFGFVMDAIIMWCVCVPTGFIVAFVFDLSPVIVYFILYLDEFVKMPLVVAHYRSGKWLKNITRDFK